MRTRLGGGFVGVVCAACAGALCASAQEQAAPIEAVSVSLSAASAKPGQGTVDVVLSDAGPTGRRLVPLAVQIGTSTRIAIGEAELALVDIRPHYGAQEEQYRAWVRGETHVERQMVRPGVASLAKLESKLGLSCPQTVTAGEPIALAVKSIGNHDIAWHVYIVYPEPTDATGDRTLDRASFLPDTGQYEMQAILAGAAVQGSTTKTISFNTYPADRGVCLGVRVENPVHAQDGVTIWVKVQ
jgi:hypothetical protein